MGILRAAHCIKVYHLRFFLIIIAFVDNGPGIICYREMSWSRNFLNYFGSQLFFFRPRFTLPSPPFPLPFLPSSLPSPRSFFSFEYSVDALPPFVFPFGTKNSKTVTCVIRKQTNCDEYIHIFLPSLSPPPNNDQVDRGRSVEDASSLMRRDAADGRLFASKDGAVRRVNTRPLPGQLLHGLFRSNESLA